MIYSRDVDSTDTSHRPNDNVSLRCISLVSHSNRPLHSMRPLKLDTNPSADANTDLTDRIRSTMMIGGGAAAAALAAAAAAVDSSPSLAIYCTTLNLK